ncbi:MAG: sulfotransferase family protein [Endozoicomonas sp.]|uniref:sulfotransferase family protein n=1 Tax=Endozoicomonas sp. TaxID=1892382 RepID=UPI003D9AF581
MSKEIRINDLRDPVYTDLQKSILEFDETLRVELSRESVLAEAREKTGLDDFGDSDFLERLDLLVNEWNSDSGLRQIGRMSLFNKLVQHASSRLLIHDVLKKHPAIHDIKIEKPIIVAGLPRSGTTHLLNLMASDQRLRALPLWESYEPVPVPGEELLSDGTDPRYQRCSDTWEMMKQATPYLAAMHPMNPDHIHEELELMGPDFASYNYEWLTQSPRWRDHYYATDQTPHYEYMKTVLKILIWQQRDTDTPTRWVLKCPQHLEQLPVLLKVFPDATIAVTHRDPVSVIQSTVTMLAYGQRMSRKSVNTGGLIDYWPDRIEHLLRACSIDRSKLPDDQSIDVPFHEFMADDLAMVEKIYSKAGLEMTVEARQQLQGYVDAHPRGKEGQVIYDLEGDFGISRQELSQRFSFYFDQFPVKQESR